MKITQELDWSVNYDQLTFTYFYSSIIFLVLLWEERVF